MHILTITSLFPNSVQPVHGVFVHARMDAFTRAQGHQWSVVAPVPWFPRLPFRLGGRYRAFTRIPFEETWEGRLVLHPRYLVTPKLGMRFYGRWMASGVAEAAAAIHARRPVDVVDGHYIYPDGTAALEIGRRLGVPVVLSARGTDLNLFPRLPAVGPLVRRNLRDCDALICVSADLARIAQENGAPSDRVRVIGNGVDTRRFVPADRNVSRSALGLPKDKTLILCVGHLVELKGFHLALEAIARLERNDLFLVVVGEGPERPRLERRAAELGLSGQVRMAGAVGNDRLPPWYAAADLFFLGSSREGWPNVVCEAQAMGLPVVATGLPILKELVPEPWMGRLAAERSVEALTEALGQALRVPFDRERIALAGRTRSWEGVSAQLQKVFTAVRRRA